MKELHIVLDGPVGPESGRFVECEDETGAGVGVGEWRQVGNLHHLVIDIERFGSVEHSRQLAAIGRAILGQDTPERGTPGWSLTCEMAIRQRREKAVLQAALDRIAQAAGLIQWQYGATVQSDGVADLVVGAIEELKEKP